MNTNLTALEAALLTQCLNYDTREDQMQDNYTNADLSDAHSICGGKHQAAGVIGSLCKKGFIADPANDEQQLIWLTVNGINAIFDHINENSN
jgi:hypothetical protein